MSESPQNIQRQTIIFFLPLQLEAISGSLNTYSVTHPGHPDPATGVIDPFETATYASENAGEDGNMLWSRKQLYMNPQTITIRDKKFIKSDLTKGGFVTQYWGEDLTAIEISGITGSAGIEGINVLRSIYRHEQTQYRNVLQKRQEALAAAALEAAAEAAAMLKSREGLGGTLTNILDVATGGAYSETISGIGNTMDILMAPFRDGTAAKSLDNAVGIPSLAAFATNVDMYYQGVFFRGYFENFSSTETAQEPGHFSYQFTFKVTRKTGQRENFMPWHRDPYTSDGTTRMSSKTTVMKGLEGAGGSAQYLSFPLSDEESTPPPISGYVEKGNVSSKFSDPLDSSQDENDQGVNRRDKFSGS